MSQTQTIGKHKTKVFTEDNWTKVVYYETCVVKWNEEEIVLDSGGFRPDPDSGLVIQGCYKHGWETECHAENRKEAQELLQDYQRNCMRAHRISRETINGEIGSGATTMKRINQASNQYLLGISIYQENFNWFIVHSNFATVNPKNGKYKTIPFKDNIRISRATGLEIEG